MNPQKLAMKYLLKLILLTPAALFAAAPVPTEILPESIPGAKPRNVVFILSDDHRHDAMSFLGHQVARGFLGGVRFLSVIIRLSDDIVQGPGDAGVHFDLVVQPVMACLAVDLATG